MTREEFKKQGFSSNMYTTYMGYEYYIASVNFYEDLLGLSDSKNNDDSDEECGDLLWVRCESIDNIIERK